MNNSSATIILHLSLIEGIGPGAVTKILSSLGIDAIAQVYDLTSSDFVYRFGFKQKVAEKLVQGLASRKLFDQEQELIEKHKISWVTFLDPVYPELLKTIHMPPTVLYWQGTLPSAQSIAIVGSRAANSYGKMAIDSLVPDLVAHDFTIVSGGALGADTMAHRKTLDEGGTTAAVLGSGLLMPYPLENIDLFEEILESGGAMVSNFPLLMEPLPANFPARNRVISGLSRGCIVIQAAAQSGARITADFTLSQGREVFAVPGPINDILSAGCHELIGQGAKLITKSADVLVEFGYDIPQMEMFKKVKNNHIHPALRQAQDEIRTSDASLPGETLVKTGRRVTPAQMAVPIDPSEAIILAICKDPCAVDEILEATGLPLIQLSKMLFDLQIKGLLTQNMAGLWESFETRPGRSSG